MSKINVFIPVEIKKRDFASRSLIGYLSSLRNFNVFIGRKLEIDKIVFNEKPGIYFGLVTTEAYSNFYKKLKKYGHYIFVNDEEGLVTFSDEMYFNLKVSRSSLSQIDLLFLWSITHKKMFTDRYSFKNKFVISGSPRYDFAKKNFINIFNDEVKYIKQKYKKYILICCSFSFANYYLKNVNYVDILKKQKVIRNEIDLKKYNKYLKYNNEALLDFIEAIKYLSIEHKDKSIIIRPHPSENHDTYSKIANNYSNVFLESQFSIHAWILNAECIVHNYCTSSSEALALRTPRFALRKSFDAEVHKTIPYESSIICKNKEELSRNIRDLYNKKIKNNDKNLILNFKKYLHNIDDQTYASKIIVNKFTEFLNHNPHPKLNYHFYFSIKFLNMLKIFYRFFFNKKNYYSKYIKHKVDKITSREIIKLVDVFVLNNKEIDMSKIKITQYSKNIVRIVFLK